MQSKYKILFLKKLTRARSEASQTTSFNLRKIKSEIIKHPEAASTEQ
jgi:hypothetical protein